MYFAENTSEICRAHVLPCSLGWTHSNPAISLQLCVKEPGHVSGTVIPPFGAATEFDMSAMSENLCELCESWTAAVRDCSLSW